MKSSWDQLKAKSNYHFDPKINDNREDVLTFLGQLDPNWNDELKQIIQDAKPANWETRGFKGEGVMVPKPELAEEEYDLERAGIDPKVTITDLAWKLGPKLQSLSNQFGLKDCMERIHVQQPGQLWHLHIDKLYKWLPEDPDQVMRVFIQLTDWQPGQFWEYGTYHYRGWRAGEVTTFDWQNLPHCTANAGFHPRVTLQLTGIKTKKTQDMLDWLAYRK